MLRKLKFLALAAAFGAQCSIAEEWIFDPLGWRYSDSELVTSGSGFALSQKGSAVRLAVAGEFIPESCQDGGWSTLGVGVFSGENDFWKLSLVRGPDSSNPVHTFELGEMRNGEWMSQIRLPCSLNRISGKWEFGEKYRLKLELSPQGIEGSVRKCEDGVELFRCRYEFPANSDAVRSGCGALHASGGFRARMLRGGVRIQEPSVEREPVFPPYSSAVARAPLPAKPQAFFE